MPSFTRSKSRNELAYVAATPIIYFGWKRKDITSLSGISSADLVALGQITKEAFSIIPGGKIIAVGAKTPKPHTVTKSISNALIGQQKSVSTFCAFNQLQSAQKLKWRITKNKQSFMLQPISPNKSSMTAIATLSDGSFYCFPMNKADFETFGAELGLSSATIVNSDNERNRLISGTSAPKPGKAKKQLDNGTYFSSFYSTSNMSNLLSAGYEILGEEIVLGG